MIHAACQATLSSGIKSTDQPDCPPETVAIVGKIFCLQTGDVHLLHDLQVSNT